MNFELELFLGFSSLLPGRAWHEARTPRCRHIAEDEAYMHLSIHEHHGNSESLAAP